jgi:uncharacterized BrkB/YihY/UPF0761 family membrane protein
MASGVQLINPFVIIGGSLTFVAGLAWNNAIQAGIDEYYPITNAGNSKKNLQARFLYAVIITIIIVIFALFLKYANDQAILLKTAAVQFEQNRSLSKQYSTT